MIKRNYFVSVKKIHGDGSGSYSFQTFIASKVSWLEKGSLVYDESRDHAETLMKDKPGNLYEITSFNRI